MPSSNTTIEVPEALARAMAYALMSRSEVAREFRRITGRASDYAAEHGLSPDTLDALLHEDDGG